MRRMESAAISRIEIERTRDKVRVDVHTAHDMVRLIASKDSPPSRVLLWFRDGLGPTDTIHIEPK